MKIPPTERNDLHHVVFLFVQFLVVLHRMFVLHSVINIKLQYPGVLRLEVPGMVN